MEGRIDNIIDYFKFEYEEKATEVKIDVDHHPFQCDEDDKIHTGVFSTMLDTVIGSAISNELGGFALTIHLNCSYFDLSKKKRYYSSAKIVHINNSIVTGEGEIIDDMGNVVARGIGEFKLI